MISTRIAPVKLGEHEVAGERLDRNRSQNHIRQNEICATPLARTSVPIQTLFCTEPAMRRKHVSKEEEAIIFAIGDQPS